MATDDDRDNMIDDTPTQVDIPAPAAPAAPAFDATAIGREIVSGLREYAMENEARQNARNQQSQAPTQEQELVIGEDDSPAMIAQKAAFNAGIPLRRQMAQMQANFENVGLGTLSQMSRAQVLDNDPTYKRYKTEVDTEIARLDPVARANPDVLRTVKDVVRARHVEDEVKERSERLVAAALKAGEGATPGGESGRSYRPRQDGVPTPEELGFGEAELRSIEMRGGPDQFARKMSQGRFSNWADYVKSHKKRAEAVKANKSDYTGVTGQAVQMNFRRHGDKPKS